MGERCVEFYNGWVLEIEELMTIQVSDPRHHDMLDISIKAETFDSTGYRSDQVNAEIAELSFEKHTLSFDFIDDYSDVPFRHYIDCSTGLRFTNDHHGRYMHLDGSPREDYTAKSGMAVLHVDDGTKKVLLRHRRD